MTTLDNQIFETGLIYVTHNVVIHSINHRLMWVVKDKATSKHRSEPKKSGIIGVETNTTQRKK